MRYAQLTEDLATDIAVFYGGRFQPMQKGHHKVKWKINRSNHYFAPLGKANNELGKSNCMLAVFISLDNSLKVGWIWLPV